jgi:hypothetical protein
LAENEASLEAASRTKAPCYVAKLTHFLAFGDAQFSAIAGLARCQKPFCKCSPFYAPRGDFSPLSLPPDWKAILRHDIWQKSAINPGNSQLLRRIWRGLRWVATGVLRIILISVHEQAFLA